MEDILVVRKKGNQLKLKIAKKKKNQYSSPEYRKNLNPQDANDLALFLGDLKIYCNAPIDTAFRILKKEEEELGKEQFFLWGRDN